VYDHLQVHDTDAAYHFQRAKLQEFSGSMISLMGTGGLLLGVFAKDPALQLFGYTVAVGGYGVSLGFRLASNSNRRKARDHYNIKFGYN
jgi:hypothetical protein